MNFSITEYFRTRLERLKENIKILEKSITDQEEKYISENNSITEILERKDRNSSEVEQINIDFFQDDIALFDESRQYYRQSSFLLLYAFLEDGLNKICQLIKSQFNYNLSPDDLNGSGIIRCRNYLEKVAGIKISESIWSSLDEYRLVRNQITHEFGEIENESKRKINDIVRNTPSLLIDDWGFTGFIRMEDEFLNQVVADVEMVFSTIDQEIDKVSKIRIVK